MDARLRHLVEERVAGDPALADEVGLLVFAACEGAEALADALGGARGGARAAAPAAAPVDPPAAYLTSIAVEGFRGIGARAELAFEPGPGLTLVVGRNGSGKSSFAEGLEICLTGRNQRWKDRSSVWTDGWRNVHDGDACVVDACFAVDGVGAPIRVVRGWSSGDAVGESSVTLAGHPSAATLDDLGWAAALAAWRPFLSYNELGSMFQGRPSDLHDALTAILGLDDLLAVTQMLAAERTDRDRALREATGQVATLQEAMAGLDDARAAACRRALDGTPSTWDLDAIELALDGAVDDGDPESDLQSLRGLTQVARARPEVTPDDLRAAVDAFDRVADTDAGASLRAAELIEHALVHHHAAGDGPCPVCATGRLDDAWRRDAEEQVAELRRRAAAAQEARNALAQALGAAGRCVTAAPVVLAAADGLGLDGAPAREAWAAWHAGHALTDARALADHLDTQGPVLDAALAHLQRAAAAELERREDAWRPAARALRDWLPGARAALERAAPITHLKAAERWVKAVTDEVRAARFAPIADAAIGHWAHLRQGASVDVAAIALAGTNTQRRVQIDVTVDGSDSAALGVMSQGELCSLALCMFLPRATSDESPFRFVVIDDPVQSMDPAKVDGLARVLAGVARTRQVIVLTHDERLPEAVRRLGIPARVQEVSRREGSRVEITAGRDPVQAHLEDARAAVRTRDLPDDVARRVVPGLCRQAIEAACQAAVRRRRLARGERHAEVEARLGATHGLYAWVALALFDDDDSASTGKVLGRLNNDRAFGRRHADALKNCNAGAHGSWTGSLETLVGDSALLAHALAGLP